MELAEQIGNALLAHGAVLVGALASYIKYGDRSELVAKSLGGTEATLGRIADSIARDLDEHLRPLFEGRVVNVVLEVPEAYAERAANPVGSEAYREALKEFIDAKASTLADYWKLRETRDSWCFWARWLSWLLLSLTLYEMAAAGYLGIIVRVLGHVPPANAVGGSFFLTGLLIVGIGVSAVMMLTNHDHVVKKKMQHDAP